MKSIIKNITLPALLIAALPLFTACSDDMEVGDTLHPTEAENYDAKAYISKTTDAEQGLSSTVTATPSSLIVPDDVLKFYVYLSKPVSNDVTVSVKLDTEAAAATGNAVLGADAFNMKTSTVTIKAGTTQSAEPVEVALQDGDALKNMAVGTAAMAFSLDNVSGVEASSNLKSIVWTVKKVYNNVKAEGSLDGYTAYPVADYKIWSYGNNAYEDGLNDGVLDGNYCDYTQDWGNPAWRVEFSEPKEVTAIAVHAFNYGYGYRYCLAQYKVLSSDDGENWTDNGTAVSTTTPTSNSDAAVCEFFAPVKAKYFNIVPENDYYGRRAWYVFTSEIEVFKK